MESEATTNAKKLKVLNAYNEHKEAGDFEGKNIAQIKGILMGDTGWTLPTVEKFIKLNGIEL